MIASVGEVEPNDHLIQACYNILQSRKGQEGKVGGAYMANVVFYLALPVNTRLQVGLPQAKSPQHITACHTHLKMKCLQKKLIYRDFLPKKVSHCSLKNIVSPPVVRPKPLSPKPILDLPLLRRRRDSSLACKATPF